LSFVSASFDARGDATSTKQTLTAPKKAANRARRKTEG